MHSDNPNCGCGTEACGSRLGRRDFFKLSGLAVTGLAFTNLPAMAGPFTRADFDKLVPADKKLSPEWVKSLFERGQRAVYRGRELEKIGMPIGGICAGQVYLGGDGKLWHWDIFNKHVGTGAEHYAKPMQPKSPLDQGFALQISSGGQSQVRALDRTGWSDISFNGEYPIAFIEYRDPATPVTVSKAFQRSRAGREKVSSGYCAGDAEAARGIRPQRRIIIIRAPQGGDVLEVSSPAGA